MKICPTCSLEFPESERFCGHDGSTLRSTNASADLIGTILGDRYHVLRKLGEGGMGQVYLAEHVRMKRKSAIKVMHPGMASDADATSRFNREAANACQILHPNVAAIYDFGETPGGLVYLAMEYVEGEPLARLIATAGALEPLRAAEIVSQIADGLDAAHQLGIVHRDLKPENILVGTLPSGRLIAKIVDFGISRTASEGQTVTRTGQIIGTPDYMSPEQLSGESVDHRSDVYSLAIVAFAMLTGKLPFESNSAQTSMLLRLTQPPRRLAEARPGVAWPIELQSILDRAMSLDAAARPESASAFAGAFAAIAPSVPAAVSSIAATVIAPTPVPGATSLPGSIPRGVSVPVLSGLPLSDLAAIEAALARSVGPIARVLVKRAAGAAPDRAALVTALAQEIEDPAQRAAFRKALE